MDLVDVMDRVDEEQAIGNSGGGYRLQVTGYSRAKQQQKKLRATATDQQQATAKAEGTGRSGTNIIEAHPLHRAQESKTAPAAKNLGVIHIAAPRQGPGLLPAVPVCSRRQSRPIQPAT